MTAVERLGRAYELYRRTAATRSAILLLLANLIPLVGVVFFGWSLLTILVLYWIENGIVGFWNVPKIVLAQGSLLQLPDVPPAAARLSAIPRVALAAFFSFHYGMFWFVHGVFVFVMPMFASDMGSACIDQPFGTDCPPGPFGEILWTPVVLGAIALFMSHGASFLLNYIGRGEYLTTSPTGQMGGAYGRVVVLHLTIIFGSFVVAFLGAPIGALLVLVILKTVFDLGFHLRERRAADNRIPSDTV